VAGSRVTDGMIASVLNGRVDIASADKTPTDAFDSWSRESVQQPGSGKQIAQKADWYKRIRGDPAYLEIENPEEAAQAGASIPSLHATVSWSLWKALQS